MITAHQASFINSQDKGRYFSSCIGVYYTPKGKNNKNWGAKFRIIGQEDIFLGHFETQEEAIKIYTDYHENYFQNRFLKAKEEHELIHGK